MLLVTRPNAFFIRSSAAYTSVWLAQKPVSWLLQVKEIATYILTHNVAKYQLIFTVDSMLVWYMLRPCLSVCQKSFFCQNGSTYQ